MIMSGISPEGGTGQKPTLVTSLVGGAKEAREDLVNLQLEISPIERPDMDVTVKAALRPIQITYDFVCSAVCRTNKILVISQGGAKGEKKEGRP